MGVHRERGRIGVGDDAVSDLHCDSRNVFHGRHDTHGNQSVQSE